MGRWSSSSGVRQPLAHTRALRLRAVALIAAGCYAAVLARAVQLHLFPDPRLTRLVSERSQSAERERLRGSILDRDGRLLVGRGAVRSLQIFPPAIEDKPAAARALARVLGSSEKSVLGSLRSEKRSVFLRRWLERDVAERVAKLELPGVALVAERRGHYPNSSLAAAYLGFAGYDEIAREGVELLFDEVLAAQPLVSAAADGPGATELASTQPLRGGSVQLALDAPLQGAAERALEAGLRASGAQHGSLIALDPHTGDVLVAAEAPGFDPYEFREADPARFRLRSFVDSFEPGSTVKPFTIAAALEAGVTTPDERVDCEQGRWSIAGTPIGDHHPYGVLDVRDCLRFSSNICLAKLGTRLGSVRLVSGLARFGFGQPVATSFPGTSSGVLHPLSERQVVESANVAFGQGMQASALQLALAGAVLANGGERVAPRLALALERGGVREPIPVKRGPRLIRESTARELIHMMEGVVEGGTGGKAALLKHRVAGKTGTAQKSDPSGGYSNDRYVSSFLGIVPSREPRLVVVVVLDEPRRPNHQGGTAAAPVFREFAEYAMRRWSVPGEPLLVARSSEEPPPEAGAP
jgi:cell division protein FtsI (penicillin-binding protein 3)